MSKMPLTFACGLYDRMLALHTGEVQADGIDLNFLVDDNPRKIFDRMAAGQEFDAAEISSSEYVSRFVAGRVPVRRDPGVRLARVPAQLYLHQQAAHQVAEGPRRQAHRRAALHHDGGDLHPRAASATSTASTSRSANGSRATSTAPSRTATRPSCRPQEAVDRRQQVRQVAEPDAGGRRVAAIIGTGVPKAFGRNPDIVRLYPDYRAAEMDYYRRTKIFPIMHRVVIRRDVHEQHPFVATSLYQRLRTSPRTLALKKMSYRGTLRYMLPWMTAELDEIDAVFGGDPWPYGIEANRPTLERAGALSRRAGRDRQGAAGRRAVRAGAARSMPMTH